MELFSWNFAFIFCGFINHYFLWFVLSVYSRPLWILPSDDQMALRIRVGSGDFQSRSYFGANVGLASFAGRFFQFFRSFSSAEYCSFDLLFDLYFREKIMDSSGFFANFISLFAISESRFAGNCFVFNSPQWNFKFQ